MAETNLHSKLVDIQQRLKVPKDNKNDFGGFVYRNLEDIEDKVKPLLREHRLSLTFEDEMVGIEGRVYVKAWAVLSDGENEIRKPAFAREAETPKAKTDDAQLTGSCSSYARKYAASGLFLIDNTKDADSQENTSKMRSTPATAEQKVKIGTYLALEGISEKEEIVATIKKEYNVNAESMTLEQADTIIKHLEKKK